MLPNIFLVSFGNKEKCLLLFESHKTFDSIQIVLMVAFRIIPLIRPSVHLQKDGTPINYCEQSFMHKYREISLAALTTVCTKWHETV
jgi:hypothetical protein